MNGERMEAKEKKGIQGTERRNQKTEKRTNQENSKKDIPGSRAN